MDDVKSQMRIELTIGECKWTTIGNGLQVGCCRIILPWNLSSELSCGICGARSVVAVVWNKGRGGLLIFAALRRLHSIALHIVSCVYFDVLLKDLTGR